MLNGFSYLSFAKSSSVIKRAAKRHLSFPKTLFAGLHNPNLPGVDEVFGRHTAHTEVLDVKEMFTVCPLGNETRGTKPMTVRALILIVVAAVIAAVAVQAHIAQDSLGSAVRATEQ